MNYLAHLLLADRSGTSLVGNLLGDFLKGPLDGIPERFRAGVRMHRRVDVFTDNHPLVQRSKKRLDPSRWRVAGIVVDMCYDHFLARDWEHFSELPLSDFCQRVYDDLDDHAECLPDRLKRIAPSMRADDWLGAYREPKNIALALNGIARRLSRPELLRGSGVELFNNYAALGEDFASFFPQLLSYVEKEAA